MPMTQAVDGGHGGGLGRREDAEINAAEHDRRHQQRGPAKMKEAQTRQIEKGCVSLP